MTYKCFLKTIDEVHDKFSGRYSVGMERIPFLQRLLPVHEMDECLFVCLFACFFESSWPVEGYEHFRVCGDAAAVWHRASPRPRE